MSAEWPELGIVFTVTPADREIRRLRDLLRGHADWWSAHYERVCDENMRLRTLLVEHGIDLEI